MTFNFWQQKKIQNFDVTIDIKFIIISTVHVFNSYLSSCASCD